MAAACVPVGGDRISELGDGRVHLCAGLVARRMGHLRCELTGDLNQQREWLPNVDRVGVERDVGEGEPAGRRRLDMLDEEAPEKRRLACTADARDEQRRAGFLAEKGAQAGPGRGRDHADMVPQDLKVAFSAGEGPVDQMVEPSHRHAAPLSLSKVLERRQRDELIQAPVIQLSELK
jgi:hypothetical protein